MGKKVDRIDILQAEIRFLKAKVKALTSALKIFPEGRRILKAWRDEEKAEKVEMRRRANRVLWRGLCEGFGWGEEEILKEGGGDRKKKMGKGLLER